MIHISPQQARHRRRGEELHIRAAVVAPGLAGLAREAGDVGFDGDAVADAQGGDGRVGGDDLAGGFVAQDVVGADNHGGAYAAGVPEVDITSVSTLLVMSSPG